MTTKPLESSPHIGLHILDEMPEMQRVVCVRKRARYEDFSFMRHLALTVRAGRRALCHPDSNQAMPLTSSNLLLSMACR